MAKALMLVWTSPVAGRDEEFRRWYDTVHIPDVRTAVPSVAAATRYRLARTGEGPPRYLTVYELEAADTGGITETLGAAFGDGRMELTPAMDMTDHPPVLEFYVPAGDT